MTMTDDDDDDDDDDDWTDNGENCENDLGKTL